MGQHSDIVGLGVASRCAFDVYDRVFCVCAWSLTWYTYRVISDQVQNFERSVTLNSEVFDRLSVLRDRFTQFFTEKIVVADLV